MSAAELVSPFNVELAVVRTLTASPVQGGPALLVYFLAAVERVNGLTPRALPVPPSVADSYYGGVDHDSWVQEALPSLIVVAQPTGIPERFGAGEYTQWFEIAIGAVVIDEDEDSARHVAQHYGAAIQGAILTHGSLGGFAEKTVLTGSPLIDFPDPEIRNVARSVTTFHSLVDLTVDEQASLISSTADPYALPPAAPIVQTVDVTVTGIPVASTLP